jgi:hypothetical protein
MLEELFKKLVYLALLVTVVHYVVTDVLVKTSVAAVKRVERNYSEEVEALCGEYGLPDDYFKALIILECSGQKPSLTRFEPAVFERLKEVRDGRRLKYSTVEAKDLRGVSDATLRLLATSWGPLQVMGYHCFDLGVSIDALIGEECLRWSLVWCQRTYGGYLKRGEYKDAFHIHNTGKPMPMLVPTTYDPLYVYRGLKYLTYF